MTSRGVAPFTLSAIRGVVNGFLNAGTGVIQQSSNASDGAGGFTPSWSTVSGGSVVYRLNPMTFGQIETLAAAVGVKAEYVAILPYNAPIVIGNRFVAGSIPYQVRWMQPDTSDVAFVKCYLSRDV
jgi:hypothetical protein